MDKLFDKLIVLYDKLSLPRVLLAIFVGVSYIFLYATWEQRSAVFITITGNVAAMVSIAIGFGLLALSGIAWLIVAAFDRKHAEIIKVLSDRLGDSERTIKRLEAEVDRLQGVLTNAVKDERDMCDRRLDEMKATFERILRQRPTKS